jgi:hypothetical protein
VQAQAGARVDRVDADLLQLANDWLQGEYLAAAEAIEAQIDSLARGLAS